MPTRNRGSNTVGQGHAATKPVPTGTRGKEAGDEDCDHIADAARRCGSRNVRAGEPGPPPEEPNSRTNRPDASNTRTLTSPERISVIPPKRVGPAVKTYRLPSASKATGKHLPRALQDAEVDLLELGIDPPVPVRNAITSWAWRARIARALSRGQRRSPGRVGSAVSPSFRRPTVCGRRRRALAPRSHLRQPRLRPRARLRQPCAPDGTHIDYRSS